MLHANVKALGYMTVALLCLTACQPTDLQRHPTTYPPLASQETSARDQEISQLYEDRQYQSIVNKILEQDSQCNSCSFETRLYYAGSLRYVRSYAQALEVYEALYKDVPDSAEALEGAALALVALGNHDQALSLLHEVLTLDATRWKTINALGVVYSLKGRREEALDYYKLALEVDQVPVAVLNNMGLSLSLVGDVATGLMYLKEARDRVNPEETAHLLPLIEQNMALAYGVSDDMSQAETLLRKYLKEERSIYNNLAYYAKLRDDQELAKAYLSKSLAASQHHYATGWENKEALESGGSGRL